jgi:long-chain acyl-CoA synthetase
LGIDFALPIHYTAVMTNRPWYKFYDPGVPTRLSYPAVPLQNFLEESARKTPEKACTIFNNSVTTFGEMNDLTDQLAGGLVQLGIGKGDRVGIFLSNSPQFVLAYFGILKAGGVVVATNPSYTPPEIEYQVNDAGIRFMFVSDSAYARLKEVRSKTQLQSLIVTGKRTPQPGDLRIDDLLGGNYSSTVSVQTEDIALLQYSGGTTGLAKGAVVLHRNLVANTLQFKAWMLNLEEGKEITLLAIPMYHVYGMVCGMCLSLALGACMVLVPDPRSIGELLGTIQKYHPTYFPAVPTLYNAINNHPDVQAGKYDLSSIKACISGSAPLMKETKEKFEKLTGGRICEGYGLSEAPTATHCNPLMGANKIRSIGLPLPDVDCRIVDVDTGKTEVPRGEVGELILKGPQVMKGYHNQLEESAQALRGGWLFTGDLARMDADGYFSIVDRKKELIKPDGWQVWPCEVEEAIATHPKVREVGVAGVPDAYHGEAVKAWVVIKAGEILSEDDVCAWCQNRLAGYKIPTQVEFRSELPRSSIGKVLRRELVRQHKEGSKG